MAVDEKQLRFNPQWKLNKVLKTPPPMTESQAELIKRLRKCLDDAGVRNDFIIEPKDSKVAAHVIMALIKLANRHSIDTGRESRAFNGI